MKVLKSFYDGFINNQIWLCIKTVAHSWCWCVVVPKQRNQHHHHPCTYIYISVVYFPQNLMKFNCVAMLAPYFGGLIEHPIDPQRACDSLGKPSNNVPQTKLSWLTSHTGYTETTETSFVHPGGSIRDSVLLLSIYSNM